MNYGIIFITAEEQIFDNGVTYDYHDHIYKDEHDQNNWALLWKGQKKHKQDYIVTECTREIHVCARKKKSEHYKYYGILINNSMRLMYQGNADNSDPDAYFFKLDINNGRLPFLTILDGPNTPQAQAVQTLGFNYNGGCCGIYKVWNN